MPVPPPHPPESAGTGRRICLAADSSETFPVLLGPRGVEAEEPSGVMPCKRSRVRRAPARNAVAADVAGCQVERRRVKGGSGGDEGTLRSAAGYLFYYLTFVVGGERRSGEGRRWEEEGKKKSVLDLIFHTPASYKRLSYTTLAANNQAGKGSQKRRNTLSLTA